MWNDENYSIFVAKKKVMTMTQITLQFENAAVMRHLMKLVELMKGVSVVKVVSTPKKSGLDMALEDIQEGRVYKAKDTEDLFKKILG